MGKFYRNWWENGENGGNSPMAQETEDREQFSAKNERI